MIDYQQRVLYKRAVGHFQRRELGQAQSIAEKLLVKNKKNVHLLQLLGHVHRMRAEYPDAAKYYKKCTELEPKSLDHHLNLGMVYTILGRTSDAAAQLEKARKINPADLRAVSALASLYEKAGEKDKSMRLLEPYIQAKQESIEMAFVLAQIKISNKQHQEAIDLLTRHIDSPHFPTTFFNVLGKAYEGVEDYEKAFRAYQTANEVARTDFDLNETIEHFQGLIAAYTPAMLARLPRPTHDTSAPIFIIGRPRSGTTLLEKILDAHPMVAGIGEDPTIATLALNFSFEIGSRLPYPKCIRDLNQDDVNRLSRKYLDHLRTVAPHAPRHADKWLSNFHHLGLIQLLWPNATVIHCKRNVMDNCWGCYVEDLQFHKYTTDLRNIGITHRLYEYLMRHWEKTLSLRMLPVNYEDVVEDQEGMSRKVIEFCGLPWDDRCLEFYKDRGEPRRAVSAITASYDQVRQPIYRSSVNRWKKFEPYLQPLLDGLAEGDRIVADLEAKDAKISAA